MVLDAAPTHHGSTVAATTRGTPWTESGFNSVWDRFKNRLEQEGKVGGDLTIHGLRYTVGDMLAEADTSLDDIRRALGRRPLRWRSTIPSGLRSARRSEGRWKD